MAKIQIKSEKLTPFGGIFSIMEQFDSMLSSTIDMTLRTCSADTILRAVTELTQENISYTSNTGKTYDFNTADNLNTLLINSLFAMEQLKEGELYDPKEILRKA